MVPRSMRGHELGHPGKWQRLTNLAPTLDSQSTDRRRTAVCVGKETEKQTKNESIRRAAARLIERIHIFNNFVCFFFGVWNWKTTLYASNWSNSIVRTQCEVVETIYNSWSAECSNGNLGSYWCTLNESAHERNEIERHTKCETEKWAQTFAVISVRLDGHIILSSHKLQASHFPSKNAMSEIKASRCWLRSLPYSLCKQKEFRCSRNWK